ncbi:MAG TPA: S1 family peptidase [Thermoanaerobaculia bacterium]
MTANAHRERLAGIVVDHKPGYRLRVRLTGELPVAAQTHAMGGSEMPVAFETGAKVTLAALRASLAKNHIALRTIFPTLGGVGIDESRSEIVIEVVATTAAEGEAVRARLPQALELLGVPARIELADTYPTNLDVRGGSRTVSSTGGLCTTAFVVKNTGGTTAVSTAAHCPNATTYYNPNGTSIPLTMVTGTEYHDPDQDVQVHTSAYTERPEFYWDDGKTTVRILSGKRLRTSTAYNDNVCHRGESTGYSCGYVQQIDYAPSNATATNPTNTLCGGQACSPVFIRLTGASLECAGGDSGGPFFASTVAFGILSSGRIDAAGQCVHAYYMSTDSLPSGWSLLYGP